MERIQDPNNLIRHKDGFDEQTKLQINSLLEEIDIKQQSSSSQSTASEGKPRYIRFTTDKERKVLSFTGKVDKIEMPAKDFETGLDIPDKYVPRYRFECYDVTTVNPQATEGLPTIWERGTRDARIILYYLSKNVKVLEIVRNGLPGSVTITYLINPPLDQLVRASGCP